MEGDSLEALELLYEDNHLLVVNKPAGMLCQGDLTGDLDLLTLAKKKIKERDGKPGKVFLGLVHRLDRPVGGVMVVAKTSKAAGRLSQQFRERRTSKIYWAVVEGRPMPTEAILTHCLKKDPAARITRVVDSTEAGKPAELAYRVQETRADQSLVEVRLITGLSHQIRAQLAAIGHPIVGDRKYGAERPFKRGRIALFARALTIHHPTKKTPLTFRVSPPKFWPF
jgi:23S rRNA pseudouridine1911/1915/1917 synthase